MKVVIDSNRIMAGLIKNSTSRIIILSEEFDFIAPDFLVAEIDKYRNYLMRKSKQTEREFDLTMLTLFQRVELIPEDEFIDSLKVAEEIMRNIDIKDAPFLAVGLACKTEGIWSEDKDFDKQNLLIRYSTRDMIDFLVENPSQRDQKMHHR